MDINNEETSSSNLQQNIHTSLETNQEADKSLVDQPLNEGNYENTTTTISGTTCSHSGMSPPPTSATNAHQPSMEDASQINHISSNQDQSELPSHYEVGGNANKKDGTPQKSPPTLNRMNESTPITAPSSSTRPPFSTPPRKEGEIGNTSTTAAITTTTTTTSSATVSGGSTSGAIPPTPIRNTKGNPGTAPNSSTGNSNITVSTPGPAVATAAPPPPLQQQHPPSHPPPYGWMPGGSPPHPYHPHPYPMHHYLHPPMYGSPDSNWSKRTESNGSNTNTGSSNNNANTSANGEAITGTSGTPGNQVQSPPPPPPPIPAYGWPPHHMGSYPYPPPPHPYPSGPNNRYPPMQPPPPHHYPWPPPMTLQPPLLHPQQRHPMNSNRNTTAKGNSTGTVASRNVKSNNSAVQSLSNKTPADSAMKSKLATGSGTNNNSATPNSTNFLSDNLAYGYNHLHAAGMQPIQNNNGTENRALSPTEIELIHRDEIQHMGCTCKKTRCLKLYCQCFGAKLYCGLNCRCMMCFNNRKHEKQRKEAMRNILSRNLSAFDTKFKKDATLVLVEQPVSTNQIGLPIPTTTFATRDTATASPVPSPEYSNDAEPSFEAKSSDPVTTVTTPEVIHSTSAATLVTSSEVARVLAHRLGCKCRKSACMKKYCECYAANVKCSASCRCMGCKNLGGNSAGGGNDYHDMNMPPMHHGMDLMSVAAHKAAHQAARQYHRLGPYPMAVNNQAMHTATTMRQYGMVDNSRNSNGLPPLQPHRPQQVTSAQTNWNDPLSAAESLTFLKRGSPAKINGGNAATHQPNRPYSMGVSPITKSPGTSGVLENGSIPSLTSSSEGDSPHNGGLDNHSRVMSTPESYRGEDSALLIAAMAMTEFGQSPPPTSSMLSPDTIRTYMEDDDGAGSMTATPLGIDDVKSTPQQPNTSKRSINFDNVHDTETKDKHKKSKPSRWKS